MVESSVRNNIGNRLIAKTYDSGFSKAHDTYNSISLASDGKIYYVLSSDSIDVGGKMFVFDPLTELLNFLVTSPRFPAKKTCVPFRREKACSFL